jgi:hypothetical protein
MSTTNNLFDKQSNIIVGLGTYTHVTANKALYRVQMQCLENPPSSVILIIKQNGTTMATTSLAPAASQEAVDLQTILNCALNDTISVVIASATSIDNQLNTVKTTVTVDRMN